MDSYADALRYIYSFADYERGLPRRRDELHLAPMVALMVALDHPERRLRAVHIAGTKGKGSTAVMIESILRASGYSVGTYTSPHLHTHRERYRIDGQPVSEQLFTNSLAAMLPAVEGVRREHALTTYTVITALAYQMFAELDLDWCVIEVGLGGRLDATNVITPAVSVITSISLDHTEVLGDTISEIAREKAGIIKAGVPAVTAPQSLEAAAVIQEAAAGRGAPLYEAGKLLSANGLSTIPPDRQCFQLATGWPKAAALDGRRACLCLLGAHQVDNALTAAAAGIVLQERARGIGPDSILSGLASARWPGRFEVVEGRPTVVIDGAHNADSISKLAASVAEVFANRRAVWVFGAGYSHDVDAMLARLPDAPLVLCSSQHPRSLPVPELARAAAAGGLDAVTAPSVGESVRQAVAMAGPDGVVVVAGSLFVAGEARETLGLAAGRDPVSS